LHGKHSRKQEVKGKLTFTVQKSLKEGVIDRLGVIHHHFGVIQEELGQGNKENPICLAVGDVSVVHTFDRWQQLGNLVVASQRSISKGALLSCSKEGGGAHRSGIDLANEIKHAHGLQQSCINNLEVSLGTAPQKGKGQKG